MCMNIVYKKRPVPKEGVGWKVVRVIKNQLMFRVRYGRIKRGVWMKAVKLKVHDWRNNQRRYRYMSGFHVYLEKPSVEYDGSKIVKVKFRGGRILGKQKRLPVVVADELFVSRKDSIAFEVFDITEGVKK